MLPETEFLIAAKHYRAGRPRAALEPLARVLEAAPESPRAQALLALCHTALGELDAAERAVDEALRLDGGGSLGHEAALHLAFRRKLWERGLQHAQAWLAQDPGSVPALRNRAIAEAMLGWRGRAIASVRQALALAPDDIEVGTHLARLLEFRHPLQARRLIDGVLARAPTDPAALLVAGRLALWQHDWRTARRAALDVLRAQADSGDATALLRLARLMSVPGFGWLLLGVLWLLGGLSVLRLAARMAVAVVFLTALYMLALLGLLAMTGDAPREFSMLLFAPLAIGATKCIAAISVRLARRAARRQVRLREDF